MSQFVLDDTVKVGRGVTIEPYAVVKGNSVLGDGCVIGSFSYVNNSVIGANTVICACRITDSVVGNNCTVGPNAHLRQHAQIGDDCRVGNFVEVKNSVVGNGVKAAHLSYIGDASVGDDTNIGCGVIFVNYDGVYKHRSQVGKRCFVGSNSNIIAPVTLGDDCFVACGTTVNKDMPDGAFGIGRSYLTVKEGRAQLYLGKRAGK